MMHLRAVDEVAELRLPEDEGFGVVAGEAVFEPEDGGLGERRIVDLELALGGADISERDVALCSVSMSTRTAWR